MSDEKDKKIDNLNCLSMPKSDWESKSPNEKIELIKKLKLEELNEKVSGFTRLHRDALWTNYSQVIWAFKDRGAKMNVLDKYNRTPLHWAAWGNHETFEGSKEKTIVEALLNAGANVNAKDDDKRTPLHFAMLNNINFWTIIEVFLKNTNIDINIKDSNGHTPLHLLAIKETPDTPAFIESVILLVRDNRIDCTIKDEKEKTALDYAEKNKFFTNVKDSFLAPQEEHYIITEWREKSQAKN